MNIAHNANKVWVIGTNVEAGGYGIYRYNWAGNNWTKIPGSAIRAAVDKFGKGWVVNKAAYIYAFHGGKWVLIPGRAWDIDVSTSHKLWVIGTNVEGGGFGIYRWDGKWTKIPGSAVRIGVDGDGRAWVVNKFGRIYFHNGSTWVLLNGLAKDIAVHDGNVAVIGTNNRIYRRWHTGNTWDVTNSFNMFSVAAGPFSRLGGTAFNRGIWVGY